MDAMKQNLHILFPRSGGGGGSEIEYHPAPSVGHEIGVMFGGMGAMLVGKFFPSFLSFPYLAFYDHSFLPITPLLRSTGSTPRPGVPRHGLSDSSFANI